MRNSVIHFLAVLLVVAMVAILAGCEEGEAGGSSLIGAGVGAGIGALAGGSTESILTGAAVGGAVGYGVGNEADKKKMRQEINSVRAEQNITTVWITNTNGSQIPVRLRKEGPGYIGPRGEYYATLPTEQDLHSVYGF